MAQVLKMLQLAQQHGVTEMEIGRRGIESCLNPQGRARGERLLQFGAQLGLANDFRRALLDVGKLFLYRSEISHEGRL